MNQQSRYTTTQSQQITQQLGGNIQVKRGGANSTLQPSGQGPGQQLKSQHHDQQPLQQLSTPAGQGRRVIKLASISSQEPDNASVTLGNEPPLQLETPSAPMIALDSQGAYQEAALIPQAQFVFGAISQPAIFVRRNTENAKFTLDGGNRSGIYQTTNEESIKSSSNLSVNSQTFVRQGGAGQAGLMISQQFIDTTSSIGSTGEAMSNNINRLSGWSGSADMLQAGRNAFDFGREHSMSSNDNRDRLYAPHDSQQIPQPAIMNLQRLGSVRIMQKNIVYVIGLSPQIAREDVLRRYEYFSQYGRIETITINKESHMSDSGVCHSAYITFSQPHEAAIAILSSDQFVRDSRLIRASFGRTKYCKFFLRQAMCQNRDCPYMHELCTNTAEIVTQGQNQNEASKKQFFIQCQKLAFQISGICEMIEQDFKQRLKSYKEQSFPGYLGHPIFPSPDKLYDKKSLFKNYGHFMRVALPDSLLAGVSQPNTATKSVSSSQASATTNNKRGSRKKGGEESTPTTASLTEGQGKSKLVQYKVKGNGEGLILRGMQDDEDGTVTKLREPKVQNERGLEYEEVKTLNSSHPYQMMHSKQEESAELTQVRPKRNNSSDERRKSQSPSPNQKHKKLANDLAQQLTAHIEKAQIGNHSTDGKAMRLLQEDKRENFYGDEDNGSEGGYHSQTRSQSIFYRQRRGSFHSTLVMESLKFLNDDTDVVPKKRGEPLLDQQYKTSPPSEVFNMTGGIGTPVPSMLGGQLDDDYHWNSTIMSNQELYLYQQAYGGGAVNARGSMLGFGGFDNKSFYSQRLQTNDLSVRPQSSNLNTTMEQMRNTTTTNSGMYPYYNTLGGGGSSSQQPQFSQDGSGRYQMIAGSNFNQQFPYTGHVFPQSMNYEMGTNLMTRSPSQPNFAGNNVHKHSLSNQKLAGTVPINESFTQMNLRTPQASARHPMGETMQAALQRQPDMDLRSLQSQYQSISQQLTPMSKPTHDIHSQTPRAPSSKAMGQEPTHMVSMTPQRLHQDPRPPQAFMSQQTGGVHNLPTAKRFNLNLDLQGSSFPMQRPMGSSNPPQAQSARDSQHYQHELNKQNLEIFNKYNQASKELLYAKIFIQGDNPGVQSKNNIFCSQSLFCYNLSQFEEESENRATKYSGKQVPMTPIKGGIGMVKRGLIASGMLEQLGGPDTATVSGMVPSVDGEDYDYRLHYTSERDDDNLTLKTSEYRAYHQDALNRESFISGQNSGIAIGVLGGVLGDGERTSTLPDNASSNDEYCRSSMQSTGGKKKRSESRQTKERKQSYIAGAGATGGGGGPDTPRELGQSKSSRKEW